MNVQRIGSVLVLDRDELHGIVSERDVLHRVIGEGRSARSTFVHEVMTRRLWTVAPETSITEAMALVTATRCRHLPVLDNGAVVGLISIGDLMAWMVRDLNMEILLSRRTSTVRSATTAPRMRESRATCSRRTARWRPGTVPAFVSRAGRAAPVAQLAPLSGCARMAPAWRATSCSSVSISRAFPCTRGRRALRFTRELIVRRGYGHRKAGRPKRAAPTAAPRRS